MATIRDLGAVQPVRGDAARFRSGLVLLHGQSRTARRIAANNGPLHRFLSNKWYFDELYNATFVRATRGLGDLFWKFGDQKIIDGLGPNGIAATAMSSARRIAKLQSGYLYHYAFVMLIGVLVLALWLIAGAGA